MIDGGVSFSLARAGILISGKHIVKEDNRWTTVSNSLLAKKTDNIPYYLYCISTSSGEIKIKNNIFKDFNESTNKFINYTINSLILTDLNKDLNNNLNSCSYAEYVNYLDSGFDGDTDIEMCDDTIKKIKSIQIGDILRDNNNGRLLDGDLQISWVSSICKSRNRSWCSSGGCLREKCSYNSKAQANCGLAVWYQGRRRTEQGLHAIANPAQCN